MSNFLWKKKNKLIRKRSHADRPYLIFLAMLVETKNFFYALTNYHPIPCFRLLALRKQKEALEKDVDKLNQMAGEYEGELATLRHRMEALERENKMLKDDLQRKSEDNDRIREVTMFYD